MTVFARAHGRRMSKFDSFENDLLEAIFNGVAIPGISENHSVPADLEVALHSASPGESGGQLTSEIAYTGYSRVTVARSGAGWTVTGSQVESAATVTFGECTAGSATATHWSVGVVGSDVGLYHGALTSSLAISSGITPSFAAGALTIDED